MRVAGLELYIDAPWPVLKRMDELSRNMTSHVSKAVGTTCSTGRVAFRRSKADVPCGFITLKNIGM